METELPRQQTPTTTEALAGTLSALWPSIVGGEAPRTALAMLVAQIALETGPDFMHVWNWNVGNLVHRTGDGHTWMTLHTYTGEYRPFRAYASLAEGTADYLRLLKAHYAAALAGAVSGSVSDFVAGLAQGGYFGAGEGPGYIAGMQARYPTFYRQIGDSPGLAPSPPRSFAKDFVTSLAIGAGVLGAAVGGHMLAERMATRRRVPA